MAVREAAFVATLVMAAVVAVVAAATAVVAVARSARLKPRTSAWPAAAHAHALLEAAANGSGATHPPWGHV